MRRHWNKRNAKTAILVVVCLHLAACLAITARRGAASHSQRGLIFDHPKHVEEGMDCVDCHDFADGANGMPDHELCSICHDFDVDAPTPETCSPCHAQADYKVVPWKSALSEERRFDHDTHTAAELACTACHGEDPQPQARRAPLKPWCVQCHESRDAKLTACDTCHEELSTDVRPTTRRGLRIAHDNPRAWEQMHGREAQIDPAYCGLCHDEDNDCAACHRVTEPRDHTVTWRRRTHGLQARWDRGRCNVCHEEDSCIKCHQNTKPMSHRGGYGRPLNRHCVNCHYPPTQTGCTVCHESIEHPTAFPSPHIVGIYPLTCRPCHPGGLPNRAPHFMNSTTRCRTCHH